MQISFPTREEIEEICKTQKCSRCNINQAEIESLGGGVYSVGRCSDCRIKDQNKKDDPIVDDYYNRDRVYSVMEINGVDVPINQAGNPINPVHAKYEKRKGERPRW